MKSTLESKIKDILAYEEAEIHSSFTTEQKMFGWIFGSVTPDIEWEVLQKMNPSKLTVFGRKTLQKLQKVMAAGPPNCLNIQREFSGFLSERVFGVYILTCLKASLAYELRPPTRTEIKEVC